MFKSNRFLPIELQIDEDTFTSILKRLESMIEIESKESNSLMVPGMKYAKVVIRDYREECHNIINTYYDYDLNSLLKKEESEEVEILDGQLDFLKDSKFELYSKQVF